MALLLLKALNLEVFPKMTLASILSSLSSVEQIKKFFMDRFKNVDFFDETFKDKYKENVWYKLGPIQWLTWMLTVLSGVLLIGFYIPTTEQAYDSIIRIQHEIPFGWLVRGMHKYAADAFIIICTMKLYRMFICADYKGNREFNLWICFFLLLLGFYSGLSGYLLIWNQRAFGRLRYLQHSLVTWISSVLI